MKWQVLGVFSFLMLFPIGHRAAKSNTNCNDSEMEDQLLQLTGYANSPRFPYPKSDQEFQQYCVNHRKAHRFLKDYAQKCLKGSSKTILSVYVYSDSQSNKKYCNKKNNKAREEITRFADCINPNKKVCSECFQTYMEKLNMTHSVKAEKDKIPYMCCLSYEMRNCMTKSLEKLKAPACTEDVIEHYGRFIDTVGGNLYNSICDGIEEGSDRCDRVLRANKFKLKRVNTKTPFPIVFRIFETL